MRVTDSNILIYGNDNKKNYKWWIPLHLVYVEWYVSHDTNQIAVLEIRNIGVYIRQWSCSAEVLQRLPLFWSSWESSGFHIDLRIFARETASANTNLTLYLRKRRGFSDSIIALIQEGVMASKVRRKYGIQGQRCSSNTTNAACNGAQWNKIMRGNGCKALE